MPDDQTPPITETLSKLEGDQFLGVFPEDMRGQGYMKDIKNWDGFVKKFQGSQALIGERQFPTDQDPPEKWGAFFDKAGRPKSPDLYNIKDIEGLPKDYMAVTKDPDIRKALWENGLTEKQANGFFTKLFTKAHQAEVAEKAANDDKFNKHLDATFGQDRKAIVDNAKKFLAAHISPMVVPYLEGMDEKSMSVLLAAVHGVVTKYAGEDTFRGQGLGTGGGEMTKDQVVGRMREIMAKKEYADPFVNRTENQKLVAEMETLRAKLGKVS